MGGVPPYIGGFLLDDATRDAMLLKLAMWSPLLGVLALLVVQALTSLAIAADFRRHPGAGRWRTLMAPLAGAALMAFAGSLLVANRASLAAADGVPFVEAIPWIVLAVLVAGVGAALWIRMRDGVRYRTVGRFAVEEG